MLRRLDFTVAALLCLALACGDDDEEPAVDGGTATDGGGGVDAGGSDAGTGVDSGGSPMSCGGPACEFPSGTGCTEAGEGCYYLISTGTDPMAECAPVGTAQGGDPCMFTTECAATHHCDVPDGATMGVCRQLCCFGSDAGCPGDEKCATVFVDGSSAPTDVGFCTPPDDCSLVDQTGCDAGEGCYPFGDDGSRQCRPAGAGNPGDACGGTTGVDCAAGSGCYSLNGSPTAECYTFCQTADPACGAGFACNPFPAPDQAAGICIPSSP